MSEPAEGNTSSPSRRTLILWVIGIAAVACTVGGYQWLANRRFQEHVSAARFAVAVGDWMEAEKHATAWTKAAPQDTEAWIALAEATRQLRQFDRTADCLGRVADSDPQAVKLLTLRGDLVLSELRQPFLAIENWQRILRIAPETSVAHQRLIYLYAITQQRTAMVSQIRTAVKLGCESSEAYLYLLISSNLQFSDGYLRVSEWRKTLPDNEILEVAQAIYAAKLPQSKSLRLFGETRLTADAKELLSQCQVKYPRNAEILAILADRAVTGGDIDFLRQLLSEVPPELKEDSRFWRFRGWLALAEKRTTEAIAAYEQALQLHPFDWRSRHELAEALRLAGQSERTQELAAAARLGKDLEHRIFELPNSAAVNPQLLEEILNFAVNCGDIEVADSIRRRLRSKS